MICTTLDYIDDEYKKVSNNTLESLSLIRDYNTHSVPKEWRNEQAHKPDEKKGKIGAEVK